MAKAAVTIFVKEMGTSMVVSSDACGADCEIITGSDRELMKELIIEILKTSVAIPH